jgi:hypothetical protein
MSREAFAEVMRDFESWDPEDAFEDEICLYEVSKVIRGEYRIVRKDDQYCKEAGCKTRKHYDEFRMEIVPGPCDSDLSREAFSGEAEGDMVAAYKDADPTQRGGHTARFKWSGAGSALVGRMRGIINAGTHHDPVADCEPCDKPWHAEGWVRAAVVDGHSEGCRVAAMYALNFDPRGEEGGEFIGTMEGLLICQCD